MTRIEHLNHVMQRLKRKGVLTPTEYETHNEMIHAVELLEDVGETKDMAELMNLWEYEAEPLLERTDHDIQT